MSRRVGIRGLELAYGDLPVLAGLDLDIEAGTIASLVGPSGSGKSSLLSVLTGSAAATAGTVEVGDEPLGARRPFAYMPQRDALLPWRRILDNAILGLEVQGVRRREARRRADALFGTFGLDGTQARYPRQLSGGMRQRVSLLRTVLQDKPVLLLDEPFGALDAITREQLQDWLLEIWAQHRWTILLITHDIREAVRLSDRVHVLSPRPGRVVDAVDVPRDIPRGDGYLLDPRTPPIEERLHRALRAGR